MRRILIVDDEPAILFAVNSYLGTRDYLVDVAEDLQTAEELLARIDFDVVVTDLRLSAEGKTEGLDILRFIRDQRMSAKTILLTAYGSTEVEAQATALNVDRYLEKPIELAELSKIIATLTLTPSTSLV
ncbi:MAG TPA: response regulator [Thermoanaerobaculia bacterium]